MKKKFLTFILSICLVIPALFIVSACSDTKNDKVQMRVEDDCIQWSINDSDWENLITVDEVLDGAGPQDVNGKQVEFNITSTHIQWRYVGTDAWYDLVALEDVTDDDNAEDEEVVKYTVTYDYNTTLNLEELMTNYKTSESIEHNKAILNMPSLDNEDFEGYFLGWYIKWSDEKVENNDVIDDDITLEARWNNKFRYGCSYSEVVDDGYVLAINCTNNPIVIVPEVFNGPSGEKNVVKITASMGSAQEYLEQVVLPSTLKEIDGHTFNRCKNLSEIVIPASVESIGSYAFYGCISLESIIVDSNNAVYDSRENCNAIIETNSNTLVYGCKTTKIPNSVKSIGERAFGGCTSLSEIKIPKSVITIDESTFAGCTNLKTIIINSSVIANGIIDRGSIGLNGDSDVQNIYIKTGLDTAQSTYLLDNYTKQATTDKTGYDKWVRNDEHAVIYDYNTTLNLEELMTNYKTSEFIEHNKAILNMPSLDNEDFEGYFLGWYIKGTDEKIGNNDVIDENVTLEARWNNKFYYGCSYSAVVDDGYVLAINCTNNPIVIVPEVFNGPSGEKNVVKITASMGSAQEYLEQVVLPSTLKEIDGHTFNRCNNLSEIVIPASVESIGSVAFYGCTSLKTIIIDSSVIANGIIDSDSMGAFVDNAVNIYIKTGLDTAQSTYLLNNYTKQATTDKTGYDKWVRNA